MSRLQMAKRHDTSAGRAMRMAGMGASVAGSYLGYLLQRVFLDEPGRKAKLSAAHGRAARRMRDDMMSLRGPAMKLGQALSLQSGVLPDEALIEFVETSARGARHASIADARPVCRQPRAESRRTSFE